jgi:voltage-gated potassium channel
MYAAGFHAQEASMMRDVIYRQLHGTGPGRLTGTQRFLVVAILVAVVVTVLDTEPDMPEGWHHAFRICEAAFAAIFAIEYLLRLWAAGENPEYAGLRGRLRYVTRPVPVCDFLALLPFLLGSLGAESLVLRALRAMRLLALSKLVRYSRAMQIVISSVVERRYELLFALLIASLMILGSSTALYLIEGATQPKAFGSILRSMWWSVVTLTTVGYGDVFPLTPVGKVFAGITAVAGIGMIAMPTGILAAAFSDGFARARRSDEVSRPASA